MLGSVERYVRDTRALEAVPKPTRNLEGDRRGSRPIPRAGTAAGPSAGAGARKSLNSRSAVNTVSAARSGVSRKYGSVADRKMLLRTCRCRRSPPRQPCRRDCSPRRGREEELVARAEARARAERSGRSSFRSTRTLISSARRPGGDVDLGEEAEPPARHATCGAVAENCSRSWMRISRRTTLSRVLVFPVIRSPDRDRIALAHLVADVDALVLGADQRLGLMFANAYPRSP